MAYPDRVAARDDVTVESPVYVLPAAEFERACTRARRLDGGVAAVVRNDDGALLLVDNEWSDGYLFPGGGVEPGEDWARAAAREAVEETGVAVDVERPLRVERERYEHAATGERVRGLDSVTFLATPTGDEAVADDPGVTDEDIRDVAWFNQVPDNAEKPDLVARYLGARKDE